MKLNLFASGQTELPWHSRGGEVFSVTLLAGALILGATGCGPKESAGAPGESVPPATAAANDKQIASAVAAGNAEKPMIAEVPPKGPATVAEVVQTLDLRKFPLMDGVDRYNDAQSRVANLSYKIHSDVKTAYEFQRKNLTGSGWKELPDAYVTDQMASSTFGRNTFVVSVTVSPASDAGVVDVMIVNHSNVNLAKLPMPPNVKPMYEGPLSAMYVTEAPVDATAETCKKLLLADGWTTFGSAGNSAFYLQNAVRLNVTVSSAPAQGGKTMISYASEQLSADLPAPPDAEDVEYVDAFRRLRFSTALDKKGITDFYKPVLGKKGLIPNHDETYRVDDRDEMVFRDAAKGALIFLEIKQGSDNKKNVELSYTTIAEIDEAEKRSKEKGGAGKKAAEEPAAAPAPTAIAKVSITLPAGAAGLKAEKRKLEFTTGSGTAKAITEAWQKEYSDAGWKMEKSNLSAQFGAIALSKDDGRQILNINYTDSTGVPAEFTIYADGADFEVTNGGAK